MAIVQRLLRSAFSRERLLYLPTARCVASVHSPWKNPAISNRSLLDVKPVCGDFTLKYTNNLPKLNNPRKPHIGLLSPRIDEVILPMSPIEQLINLRLPTIPEGITLEMPTTKASLENAQINQKVVKIQAPQHGRVVKHLAIRMLVIRRKKLKKHKRKKYLKKFQVHLMTLGKKRDIIKETIFLSALEQDMKLAESFDAKKFAKEKIRKAYEPLPTKEALIKPLPWEFEPLFYNSQNKKK